MNEVQKPKKRKTWLWVLGWLFILPLPLTILLARNKKLPTVVKLLILIPVWVVYLLFIYAAHSSPSPEKADAPAAVVETTAAPTATPEATPEATVEPTPTETEKPSNPLDKIDLSHEEKVKIYSEIEQAFMGPDNPAFTVEATGDDIQKWEDQIIAEIAEKHGIDAATASSIYTYASLGYLYNIDLGKVTLYGDLLDINASGTTVIVKMKIKPQLTNKLTINQNYMNACNIIRAIGDQGVESLDYWAVADMTSGSESKAVSFTVPGNVIKRVATTDFPDITLGDYVTDLWILPSLKQ